MFVKYNGILRGMGDVRDATRHPKLGWVLKRDLDAQERDTTKHAGDQEESRHLSSRNLHWSISKLAKMSYRNINNLQELTSPLALPLRPGDAERVHRGEPLKVFEAGEQLDFQGNLYPTTIHTLDGMLRKLANPSPSPSPNPDPNPNPNQVCCASSPR